jgi:hydrogenase maturation protein HypF
MLESGFNCPLSSGCGRLFDAVSAMLGICSVSSYDGQAAAALGALVDGATEKNDSGYRFTASGGLISPRQLLRCIIRDLEKKVPAEIIALRFHDALADIMAKAALEAALKYGLERVVLSGGVFQNQYLSRKCRGIMEGRGLKVYTHSQVPCSDAGIAFGQVAIGLWRLAHGGVKICA